MLKIDQRHIGAIDGFEIDAYLAPDDETRPDDFDSYDPEQIEAWRNDDWSYVGTVVTASRAGLELGNASLWGSEYGLIPGVEGFFVSPLDGDGDYFVNGYGPDLIAEAIAEAHAKLAELTERSDNA